MRLPRLKMRQGLVLVAVAAAWLWLQKIGGVLGVVGTLVLALMLVSLRHRGRVAGEIKAEVGRDRTLSLAGIIGYSMVVVLALAWLACIWAWQVFDHESLKNGVKPDTPARRAKLAPLPGPQGRLAAPDASRRPGCVRVARSPEIRLGRRSDRDIFTSDPCW